MIAIVGATGTLGRELTLLALAGGRRVAAVTRHPARAAELARAGAEVRAGDLTDADSLRRACAGADVVVAAAHGMLGRGRYRSELVDDAGHRALIDAARAAGATHFLYISVLGASPRHPIDFWRTKHRVEDYLKASGTSCTILRPAAFMETHAHSLLGKAVLEGKTAVVLGRGETPVNFVAARDVAHVAVTALDDTRLRGRTLEVGGPENLTRNEVAELYGRIAGRAPRVRHIPVGALRALAPVAERLHPGIGRVVRTALVSETTDQTFDPTGLLREVPMRLMRLEDFARQRAGAPPARVPAEAVR